jgi:predicted ATP-binding protein involved in virulence
MKIKTIQGIIPYTDKHINIKLYGNSLILTGKNGCGKTQLLESIFQVLLKAPTYESNLEELQQAISQTKRNIEIHNKNIESSKEKIKRSHQNLESLQDEDSKKKLISNIKDLEENIKSQQNALESRKSQLQDHHNAIIDLNQHRVDKEEGGFHKKTIIEYQSPDLSKPLLALFFKASRLSNFQAVDHITSTQTEIENIEIEVQKKNLEPNAGALIERFLASWEVQSALSEKIKDYSVSNDLSSWKKRFTGALKILLDDESTEINFNSKTLNYTIQQSGKVDFSFRDLSSGYSAILSIFTELLMQTEVSEHSPNTIPGFVVIDEIDAHLHASLQRKVLPFFTDLFPQVQFIVSTHSPFVITSADNVIAYDLSTQMLLDPRESDLRFFSMDQILEDFFDVPINSVWLMKKMKELNAAETFEKLNKLIGELSDAEEVLEPELLSYFYTAKIKLEKLRKGETNV